MLWVVYTCLACSVPWVRAALHKALGHAACRTRANSWTLELRPQPRPPRGPLLSSPRWLRLPESRSGGRARCGTAGKEGRAASGAAAPAEVACRLRSHRWWCPGPCWSAGATGSMKGGDREYTRGPSLGWLFAKCCCCFPCRGE